MEKIGKYEIIRELGKGATSAVYLANDPFANRQVAIKLVRADALGDKEHGKRFHKLFLTEASLAGKLSHPHIVSHLRCGRRRGGQLSRHGIRRGRHPRAVHPARIPAAGQPRHRDHFQVLQGARLCASARHHSPRHQAGEHPAYRRNRHQDLRLRRRAHDRGGDHAGVRNRLAGVHVPGAGAGT